ncbi:MAG: AraC family transcriptional regulator [Treponema sp.]|jgi:AraC-like DNA-binding protein|nr:AraC family transcriptional regulator [Treponema sp.]
MDPALIRASQRLSETPIIIVLEGYTIEVYWFRVMIKEGDWYIRRHAHSTYEFHFCAQGECMVDTDANSFLVKDGYFYLSSPGTYHTQRPANKLEFIEYSLNCNMRKTEEPKSSLAKEQSRIFSIFSNAPCLPTADRFGILSLFRQALVEAEQRKLGYEWMLHTVVPQMLVASARAIEQEQTIVSSRNISLAEPNYRMLKIEEYVQANINKDLSPHDIAQYMHLSDKQVARIVYAYKGFPTKKYITRTKLKRAKELLTSADMPIKEIAERLGFSSEYYFNVVFKLHEGVPPGVFRSSMITDPL